MTWDDRPANIFSVDVEDWFHIPGFEITAPMARWNGFESRVERSFRVLLDAFSEGGATATCFFLGWVAERFPHLVREAIARGHEIASHGYAHELIDSQTPREFAADVRRAKDMIEQAGGVRVRGYRAPSFSITESTRWALDELVAAGYEYDSSMFPGARDFGGIDGIRKDPHLVPTRNGTIVEFPISVTPVLGKELCFFGGGYLRLFPYRLIRRMARAVNRQGRPVIYYVHPREVDPEHPRMPLPPLKHFKCYVNLETTLPKLRALMRDQRLTTFRDWMAANRVKD